MSSSRLLRILHLLLTPILIAALSYDYARNVDRTQLEVSELSFPLTGDEVVAFIPFGKVQWVEAGSMTVLHRGSSYVLDGHVDRAGPGDVVSLEVNVRGHGELEIVRGHLHRYRMLKWLSGVVAMAFLGTLLVRSFLVARSPGHG